MTATPVNPAFYADPHALSSLKSDAKARDPAALKAVAKQFESLFTQMLMKSMREASKSFGDSMFDSQQTDFYQGMFDDQLASHLSQGKGLGLADMLVKQLSQSGLVKSDDGAQATGDSDKTGKPQAAGPTPIAASKDDFIRSMWPHAQKAASEIGVDPHALLAQAALETGWGKSVPGTAAGDSSNNLFGIKAGSQWSGATVKVPTLEFEDGVAVRKVDSFRSYNSPADSFRDYAKLIRNSPRYENAVGAGPDVATFASALQEGGYATDPEYARKIVAITNEIRGATGAMPLKIADATPIASGGGV
ncbi:MAG TPA: flagellar assembly peptidoglycan hydrolase FlgJ [Steroidobacteraceae bacterium]|jgi:flagellar protein FlgJ